MGQEGQLGYPILPTFERYRPEKLCSVVQQASIHSLDIMDKILENLP
jgi:hypothetical protein